MIRTCSFVCILLDPDLQSHHHIIQHFIKLLMQCIVQLNQKKKKKVSADKECKLNEFALGEMSTFSGTDKNIHRRKAGGGNRRFRQI